MMSNSTLPLGFLHLKTELVTPQGADAGAKVRRKRRKAK